MATLKANGNILVELKAVKFFTDGADGDRMNKEHKITYRAMSSGYVLKKTDLKVDYGMGTGYTTIPGTWKRHGKIKADLLGNKAALFNGFQTWADQLTAKGWDAEIS